MVPSAVNSTTPPPQPLPQPVPTTQVLPPSAIENGVAFFNAFAIDCTVDGVVAVLPTGSKVPEMVHDVYGAGFKEALKASHEAHCATVVTPLTSVSVQDKETPVEALNKLNEIKKITGL